MSFTDSTDSTSVQLVPRVPGPLLNVFDVAALVGCHEESVRRAYSCGQLRRRRFGVRGCRFDPADVHEWIRRGAPTRPPRTLALPAVDGPPPES